MNFQELMLTYGYPMLFLGVLLESEAFLLVGVYLAHRGYFSLPVVISLAALSSFCITQFCFLLGHRYGPAFIRTRPRWQLRYQRIERLMNRYGTGLVVGFRALYGLRGAIPAAVGLAGFSSVRFMFYNALGALVWAIGVTFLGSNLAQGFNQLYDRLQPSETMALSAIMGILGLWFVYQLIKRHRLKKQQIGKPEAEYQTIPLNQPLPSTSDLSYNLAANELSGDVLSLTDNNTSTPLKSSID
ncbi:DedA family protein [Spirosoma flavus]